MDIVYEKFVDKLCILMFLLRFNMDILFIWNIVKICVLYLKLNIFLCVYMILILLVGFYFFDLYW